MRTLALLLSLVALGALGLVACGGDDDEDTVATEATATGEAAAGGGGATEIRMTEYAFDPADVTVTQGDTITVTNDGELPHNYTVPKLKGGGELTTGDVDPGSSAELTVNLDPGPKPGPFGVICTIPGHAAQGMRGTLTVGGAATGEDETETESEGGNDSGGGGSGY
jgi:plastocyanin